MELMDGTGTFWTTAFGKNAEQLMGCTAEQLGQLKNENVREISYSGHGFLVG